MISQVCFTGRGAPEGPEYSIAAQLRCCTLPRCDRPMQHAGNCAARADASLPRCFAPAAEVDDDEDEDDYEASSPGIVHLLLACLAILHSHLLWLPASVQLITFHS